MRLKQTVGSITLSSKAVLMGIIIFLTACNSYAIQPPESENKSLSQTSSLNSELLDKEAAIEPEAVRLLKQMNDFMASQTQFSFQGEITSDEILPTGQKIQSISSVNGVIKRPDKFHVEIHEQDKDQDLYYNGKTVTLYGKRVKYYASIDAPSTIGETIQFLIDSVGIVVPMADLIGKYSHDVLMSDVESGFYVGLSEINGIECHHLAFRADETDWQIWIENSDTPSVRKFIITSKWITGAPQVTASYSDWNFDTNFSDKEFMFVAPEGVSKIEFMTVKTANQDGE